MLNQMNLVVCVDSTYVEALSAMLHALGSQTYNKGLRLYVVGLALDDSVIIRLKRVASGVVEHLEYIEGGVRRVQHLPVQRWLSHAAYLKLLAPELLRDDVARAIMLDADVLPEVDLWQLWNIEMGDDILCAVQDYGCPYVSCSFGIKKYRELGMESDTPYFNSGVMLLNLERWRREAVTDRCIAYLDAHKDHLRCHDQEALNAVLSNRWRRLDPRWNQMPHIYSIESLPSSPYKDELLAHYHEIVRSPYIIHFAARNKPWAPSCIHPARNKYFEHLRASGWFSLPEYFSWRLRVGRRARRSGPSSGDGRRKSESPMPPPVRKMLGDEAEARREHAVKPDRFRTYQAIGVPAGNHKVWVHSIRSGVSRVLPQRVVHLLFSCNSFKTLSEHARMAQEQNARVALRRVSLGKDRGLLGKIKRSLALGIERSGVPLSYPAEATERYTRQLEEFVRDGFLVSEHEIKEEILNVVGTACAEGQDPRPIVMLGIPTRDRPELLKRALASYLENMWRHGRRISITVVDDSRDRKSQINTAETCFRMARRSGAPVSVINRHDRGEMVRRLAAQSSVPIDVLRFALLGDDRCGYSHGAARNTLQILSPGRATLQVDDDTICQIARPRRLGHAGSGSTQNFYGTQFWFLGGGDCIGEVLELADVDFLGTHEELLGRSFCNLAASDLELAVHDDRGELAPDRARFAARTDAKIAVTVGGAVGDSGMGDAWFRLTLDGPSFERLVADESSYRRRLETRQIARIAQSPTISSGTMCFAMNLGLDNTQILPPFMPVQRKEDWIFMLMLRESMPWRYSGHLPYGIVHKPAGRELVHQTDFVSIGKSYTVNDCVAWLLRGVEFWPRTDDAERNLILMGQRLCNIAEMPKDGFVEHLQLMAVQEMAREISQLDRYLEKRGGKPKFWAEDARRYISSLEHAMTRREAVVPSDLLGTLDERLNTLQSLVGKYGQLLAHWPEIWAVASSLSPIQFSSGELVTLAATEGPANL